MTLLKQETLFRVIDAAIEAGLECETVMLSIPREAQASLARPGGRSAREQYLSILSQLNDWGASERKAPPLRTVMHTMHYLAASRVQAQVFQQALAEIDSAPRSVNEQGELLFMRTKDCYVVRGYRVVPPVEAPVSVTFQAWRGAGALSIIGVASVAALEVVIGAVKELVAQLEHGERVEGCVVLFSNDSLDIERVLAAGLVPVPYRELAPMGVREVTAFVDRQQAELAPAQAGEWENEDEEQNEELCRQLRAALRESLVRVVTVTTPVVTESARRIVLSLTGDYRRDPAHAAPLLLPLAKRSASFQELVATGFGVRKVPFSRFDFPGLLAENAFRPVFVLDSRLDDADPKPVKEVLAAGGKVVLVTSEAATPREVARRCGLRALGVRTLSAGQARSKGTGRREDSSPINQVPFPRPSPRFEQGRALLVGVASYSRVPKLPECVLSDARDLATLLKSPERCGYPDDNVELLLDRQATAGRFRHGLKRLAKEAQPDDTVVVYFSGHGFREAGNQAEAYLLPIDCDLDDLAHSAISASELTRLLLAIRSSRLVVLLDACHAAGAAHVKTASAAMTFKSGLDERTYEVLGRGAGRVVIASSRADEPSCVLPGMKNSLFTTYLLEALGGVVRRPDEDVVRVLDVFHHVSQNVPQRAAQHPILKAQDVENNFPVALSPRTKRAVVPQVEETRTPPSRNGHSGASPLLTKARIRIRHGLVTRWHDLADYFAIPLADRATFDRGHEGRRTLEWLEERGRLDQLRAAFVELGWDDLIAELDRHAH